MNHQIADLFFPYTTESFLGDYLGQSFLRLWGKKERFQSLLTWQDFNQILCRSNLAYPQLRLSRAGRDLPPETFMRYRTGHHGGTVGQISPVGLTEQIRNGATLVVDGIDKLHPPITALVEALERTIGESIEVSAFVSWGETNGLQMHWDDHDVLVLQVHGQKQWTVYPSTRPYPVTGETKLTPAPTSDPVWDGRLESGDLLYIPRGWWHAVNPVNEPTLHLSFCFLRRTGLDVMKWLTTQLQGSANFRQDVPRFASEAEQAEHWNKLKSDLLYAMERMSVQDYLAAHDAQARPRPYLSLPWAGTPDALPPTDDFTIRLTVPRTLALHQTEDGKHIEITANGNEWRMSIEAQPLLQFLAERGTCTLQELYAITRSLSRDAVREFVGHLLLEGLVAVISDTPAVAVQEDFFAVTNSLPTHHNSLMNAPYTLRTIAHVVDGGRQ